MTDSQAINRRARERRPVNGTVSHPKAGLIRRCCVGRPFMAAESVSHPLAGLIRRRCVGRPFMAAESQAKITVFGEYPI